MKDLSSLRLADLCREVKTGTAEEDIRGDLKLETKMYLKKLIEACLAEEQGRILKAPRHVRATRQGLITVTDITKESSKMIRDVPGLYMGLYLI